MIINFVKHIFPCNYVIIQRLSWRSENGKVHLQLTSSFLRTGPNYCQDIITFTTPQRACPFAVIWELLLQTIIRECDHTGMDLQDLFFSVWQKTDWKNIWSCISSTRSLQPGTCSTGKVMGTWWQTKSEEQFRQFINTWTGCLSVLWFLK